MKKMFNFNTKKPVNERIAICIVFLLTIFNLMVLPAENHGKTNFSVCESKKHLSISNGKIGLDFLNSNDGFDLAGIRNIEKRHDFLYNNVHGGQLWELKLKHTSNDIMVIDNTCECRKTYSFEKTDNGRGVILHLYWDSIIVDRETDMLNIHATIRLDESAFSYWQIEIKNDCSQYGIWEVTFPVIKGLDAREECGIRLAYPDYHGCLIKNPVAHLSELKGIDPAPPEVMNYPSARCTMQYSTLYDTLSCTGLYLATHDPDAYVKKFGYEVDEPDKTMKFGVKNYPENMGVPGNRSSYRMPYEVIVGIYEGDWITASKIYREWAVNQKWCSKGKLANRTDIPEWYLNVPIWFCGNGNDNIIPASKSLNVPVTFQWFNWHQIPFDINYPDYFPEKPGFSEKVDLFRGNGIRIIPYINARLWDINSRAWKEEEPYGSTCKVPAQMFNELISLSKWPGDAWRDMMIYMEHYAGSTQAVMCPTCKVWEEKLSQTITKLISEFRVDGVYLDQTASCMPVYCFDPTHGHPAGGGKYWVESTRTLIENCKRKARGINPEVIFTTEDSAEPYMDLFEGFLAFNDCNIAPDLIPMFQYVYSGYCMTYGRCFNANRLAFRMKNTQMFLWGEQIGWFAPPNPDAFQTPEAEYIRQLCDALMQTDVRKYLFYGEMIRPPVLEGDIPIFSTQWKTNQRNTDMPAVAHSAWKAEDGSVGLVFANMDGEEHNINYYINMNELDLPEDTGFYVVRVVYGPNSGTTARYNSPEISRREIIPGRSVLVIEYKPLR